MTVEEMEHQKLFKDPNFPAHLSSIMPGLEPAWLAGSSDQVLWKRPQEISGDPCFFPKKHCDGWPKQGMLGDCWLLCCARGVFQFPHLLQQLFPGKQTMWPAASYDGQFTVRLWAHGTWYEVMVDDRLPTIHGKLCFSSCCQRDVFWLPLLEKACAKVRGSYQALAAGQIPEGWMELTGGFAVKWYLKPGHVHVNEEKENETQEYLLPRQWADRLPRLIECGWVMCCRYGNKGGLHSSLGTYHAFALVGVTWGLQGSQSGQGAVEKFNLWNPWGHSKVGENMELDRNEFEKEMDEIVVTYPYSVAGHLQSITTGASLQWQQQLVGTWKSRRTAGGNRNSYHYCLNPPALLTLPNGGEILLVLSQPLPSWHFRNQNGCSLSHPASINGHYSSGIESGNLVSHCTLTNSCNHCNCVANAYQIPHPKLEALGLHVWRDDQAFIPCERKLPAVARECVASLRNQPPILSTPRHHHTSAVYVHGHLVPGCYVVVPSTHRHHVSQCFLLQAYSDEQLEFRPWFQLGHLKESRIHSESYEDTQTACGRMSGRADSITIENGLGTSRALQVVETLQQVLTEVSF
uniref:Calpain 10 n=1 Tax=Eptatretus burgeri TaxID=7764 RepID=A0A8C4N5F8_EPTBU